MSEACKCYECGTDSLREKVRDETFEFDTGQVLLTVNAKGVPVWECDRCGERSSGSRASRKRDSAMLDTVLAAYHELLEAATTILPILDESDDLRAVKLRRVVNSLRRVP